jgi:hypothetical protein
MACLGEAHTKEAYTEVMPSKRMRPDERFDDGNNEGPIKLTHNGNCPLPINNPYVGSFHRGAKKKKKQTKPTPTTSENFVQQFLPLGMMMAAVTRSQEFQGHAAWSRTIALKAGKD